MNEENDKKLREILKAARPPLLDLELKRDLWPQMLRRLDERPTRRVSGFDWALVALMAIWFLLFPDVILGLLYHL
jgi:hypothetical protein